MATIPRNIPKKPEPPKPPPVPVYSVEEMRAFGWFDYTPPLGSVVPRFPDPRIPKKD